MSRAPKAVLFGGCLVGSGISSSGIVTGSAPRVEVAALPGADADRDEDASWQSMAWGEVCQRLRLVLCESVAAFALLWDKWLRRFVTQMGEHLRAGLGASRRPTSYSHACVYTEQRHRA